jgi:hypothetical protein
MMGSMNSERYEGNGSPLQISPAKTDLRRLLEWTAALIGAMNCLVIPALFAQSGAFDFPFPLLYFIEIIVLGVLVLGFVALRPRLSARWRALPWIAAGIILPFLILGGFSIGFFLIPAFIAFVATGLLVGWQAGGLEARHLGYLLLVAVIQAAVMILAVLLA